MSNCVISIDITEYLPESLNFEPFGFVFRTEAKDFEEEITFSNKNSIVHMTPLKKDIKYNIKITKGGSLIGIADFTIPSANLQRKDESYSKLCSVTMTDSMKRMVFGNITNGNSIKLQVKATVQYVDKLTALKQSHSLPKKEMKQMPLSPKITYKSKQQSELLAKEPVRETKTPPMNTLKKANHKPVSNNKKGAILKSSPDANKGVNQQEKSPTSQSQSQSQSQSEQKKVIQRLSDSVDANDTSVIDPLVCEEIVQTDKEFGDFISKRNEEFNIGSIQSSADLNELIAKSKASISNIFNLQLEYYKRMNKSIDKSNLLKDFLLKYNEKFRSVIKKQNRLQELIERNGFKKEIIETIKPEEDERTKEVIPIKKQELSIYQNVFNKLCSDSEMKDFQDTANKEKENTLLVQVMKSVINTYGNISKILPNGQSIAYHTLVPKYSLPDSEGGNVPEQKQMISIPENKINEEIEEEEENNTKEDKDIENVIGSPLDQTDIKLNKYLNFFYSKRKLKRIPFKKTTPNNYEYGTQKVMLKVEGDSFRVKNIGGYNLLDKFIEINAPIEEAKMNQKKNPKPLPMKIKANNKA